MPIKSFRGLIADGDSNTIVLHTNNGSTGYKIVKFELFPFKPGQETVENVVTIHKIPPTTSTISVEIDFSDNTLLGAATFHESHSDARIDEQVSIFDNEIFNQDIYLAHTDTVGSNPVNYYIELEQISLSLDENTVATLKDIRNIKSQ